MKKLIFFVVCLSIHSIVFCAAKKQQPEHSEIKYDNKTIKVHLGKNFSIKQYNANGTIDNNFSKIEKEIKERFELVQFVPDKIEDVQIKDKIIEIKFIGQVDEQNADFTVKFKKDNTKIAKNKFIEFAFNEYSVTESEPDYVVVEKI